MNDDKTARRYPTALCVSIIVAITAVAFLPSLFNDFVEWDDPLYVTENESIRGFSPANVKTILTSAFVGTYCPLVMMTYAAEYHFFKLDPLGYHLINYLLHIAVTVLVFLFIYSLSGGPGVAFMAAVLFGVHPLHVESVAWVTELKDLLSAIFYILALSGYLAYLKRGKISDYVLCFLFMFLSLLSKPMAVTVPIIFILLDYFLGRKINIKSLFEKIPFFALALAFGVLNIYFQSLTGATKIDIDLSAKIYFLSKTILFYLSKTFMPVKLSAIYAYYSTVRPEHMAEIKYYAAGLGLLLAAIAFSMRYSKKVLFGSAFFIVTIAPVLKIITAGSAFAADRYMYLPSVGIFYILAVFFDWVARNKIAGLRIVRFAMIFFFFAAVTLFSFLTWNRCLIWKDTKTLFTDVLIKDPNIALGYNNIGLDFAKKDDFDNAIRYYKMALMVDPDYDLANKNIRIAYELKRQWVSKAIPPAAQAEKREDRAKEVILLNKLGIEQGKFKKLENAVFLFKEAIGLDPNYVESYNNLGIAYFRKGEHGLAEQYFRKALGIDPTHKEARVNLDYILSLEARGK
ncbi:MAG: hypothetical protein A2Z72_04185 [Omnitrophica bacterium RBG_13_46_9]|nr:MAG: hypothetical protein A2Z72_04185 [Omnitrophica bacterium RBG_13_46_9]